MRCFLNVIKEKERRRDARGSLFWFSGRAGAGQRKKSVGPGGVTVKLEAFSGWGGAVLKIFGTGAAIFPGGQGGA